MNRERPLCGEQAVTQSDLVGFVLELLAVLGTLGTIFGVFSEETAAAGSTLAGYLGMTLVGFAGVLGGLFVVAIIWWARSQNCGSQAGLDACWSGVVVGVRRSFQGFWDYALPFTADPPRVDVVVRPRYWRLVEEEADFVHCADDEERSPLLWCYFRSEVLCSALLGALVGAAVATAAVAAVAVAAAAALGCALAAPLCLAVAAVAFLVGAIAALIGAAVGGNIARETAEDGQSGDGVSTEAGELGLGSVVSMTGNVLNRTEANGARVAWFVRETFLHDRLPTDDLPVTFEEVDGRFEDGGIPDACEEGSA